MTSNQYFRQILRFIVRVTLSCTSSIAIANEHALILTNKLALVNPEQSYEQRTLIQQHYDELKVSHTPVVYLNSPVAFIIEAPQPISKLILYVDDVYAGGVNVNGYDTKMELLFTSPGVKELKFIGIKEEGGNVFSYKESIRVVSTESISRQENSNYDPAIVYKPLSERKRTREENSDNSNGYNGANSSVNSGNTYGNRGFSTSNSFLNEIIQNVQDNMQQNRILIPSHIVVAMAALESGYGKSPLAQNANNLFGMKACNLSPNSPDVYVYVKYPAEDCNLYRKFNGTAACVNFFINELLLHKTGKWQRDYSSIVRQYQDEINQGVDKVTATEHFIEGLVNKGYTTSPLEKYKSSLMSLIYAHQLLKMD